MLCIMVIVTGCAKSVDPDPITSTPPPVISGPSGEIQTFTLADTLVPFGNNTLVKWLVTGTNNLTVVTFNGVKVSAYGDLDTGPQKQTTTFTLAVNNGKKATVTLKVTDSITTLMWGNGRRLKKIKKEVFIAHLGQALQQWVDTTGSITPQVLDQRINFRLNGTSVIIQTSSIFVSDLDAGTFVVNPSQTGFSWRGIVYTFVSIDIKGMVVTYNVLQPNGTTLLTRDTYVFE
jgi:hypothetical protein